jgi:hypothetical protein
MRHAPIFAALLAATLSAPLQAGTFQPDVPDETGIRLTGHVKPLPFICSGAPVRNRYHGALYDRPPAVYLGFAYRPYYRYAAWRVVPRRYFCSEH